MDKIWDRKKPLTTQNRQKSNAKKIKNKKLNIHQNEHRKSLEKK